MAKKYPQFANFSEYLFYSYANLQMLCFAQSQNKKQYDRSCFMVRSKAYKAYKDGRWNIHNLFENNIAKIKSNSSCWYCGREFPDKSYLTIDHVFPRSKDGKDDIDNIIMVCKHCNSSKRDTDLFEWYFQSRHEFPPIPVLAHYLKQIYLYAKDNNLLDLPCSDLETLALPFNYKYIPLDYPQPEYYLLE